MKIKFTPENDKRFEEIIARYPRRDAAMLPVLWLAQEQFGFLSPEVQTYVAQKLDVSLARIESVVSFYTMYQTKKMGRHHLQVCRNISCNLRGCEKITGWIEKNLGLKPGETSPDGLFSYSTVECLAACGGAPAMQVNNDYYENMTESSLAKLIQDLRK